LSEDVLERAYFGFERNGDKDIVGF
jgi:hypothetical protein